MTPARPPRSFSSRGLRGRVAAPALVAAMLAGALATTPSPAAWAQSAPGDAAIRETIERQLRAFLDRDLGRAWGFASPSIQGLFGSPEGFGRMVEQGYPMIWTPRDWRFGTLEAAPDGRLRQTLVLHDAEGRVWVADYWMIPLDGAWRIDGVTLRPAEGAGA